MELIGKPDDDLMKRISHFAPSMIQSCSNPRLQPYNGAQTLGEADEATKTRWHTKFPTASPEALDLLYQLLHIDHRRTPGTIDSHVNFERHPLAHGPFARLSARPAHSLMR